MPEREGEYEVGYKRPPEATRFRKGRSGNLRGRPKKKEASAEAAGVLEEPVQVKQGGVPRRIAPFEAGVRRLVTRALKEGDFSAALEFLRLCEGFGLLEPPAGPQTGYVVTYRVER